MRYFLILKIPKLCEKIKKTIFDDPNKENRQQTIYKMIYNHRAINFIEKQLILKFQ